MLVQFSVKNFRSIKELCELSMVASNYYKENEVTNTIDTGLEDCPRLLKSIVIYGANAAGKSTILDAMSFVESFVIHSAKNINAGDEIQVSPYKLSEESRQQDSEFETTLISEGIRYDYGICVNEKRVTEEWLIAYPKGSPQKWYHRVYDPQTEEYYYKFSKYFEGGRLRGDWRRQTRDNAAFLSVAIQFNNTQLLPVYNWFLARVAQLRPENLSSQFSAEQCLDKKIKKSVIDFIASADIQIADIKIKKRKLGDPSFIENFPLSLREDLKKSLKDKDYFEVSFLREDDSGNLISFDLEEESKGTIGLFSFAGPWIDVIHNDLVLCVDELDSSLHPLIVHHLIEVLHRSETKAQIIFTTHDTTILSKKILRRDQVWLVSKDKRRGTLLYPVSDYKVREGEALEKGYLSGRYGAIPFIKDLAIDGN
ncbi:MULTISPECIES: AAA family ATPase [Pseudomonas]|uniref:AAA family ATPase n=1 Tax=Pseudomonas TaxID=286 RepID=UPI00033741B1|nr:MULTISPECIES: ATP-binding protein [Pseudomonas]EKP5710841.1 ATP-binding protein [Pseudomonas aeruginosa]EKV8092256.1 ATP-binding protein [Pseudomonas aeruginosa]EKW5159347.1 ATP-binding protein [Pseudomonas aeruginosa]EKW6388656.1 ATP-binding protein [Pseudomonas aeruginosa]EMC2537065.1 ATP-binding protein [Pseudomonas aeruginosa]